MPGREDEECFSRSLSLWLSANHPGLPQDWHHVPRPEQPPDYRLLLGNREYAVEVTRIMSPDIAPSFTFKWLAKRIETNARARGTLRGFYVLTHYPPVSGFSEAKALVEARVHEYIAHHTSDDAAALAVILADERNRQQRRVAIRKLPGGRDAVFSQQGAKCVIRDQEVESTLATLVREAVSRKASRFDEVGERAERILVLGHDYPLADAEDYRRSLAPLVSDGLVRGFAAVYLAFADGACNLLHASAESGLS